MISPRSRLTDTPASPLSARAARVAAAGLLAVSLALSVGTVPAFAGPGGSTAPGQDASTAPAAGETAADQAAADQTADDETAGRTLKEEQGALGAHLGQGAQKKALGFSPQSQSATTRRFLATPQAKSTFTPAGVLGMDVSGWQTGDSGHTTSNVNWQQQYAMGARFAYAKATEGTDFVDASFSSQYSGASSVGMLRGAYHFALPGQSTAAAQADFFVNHGGGWSPDGKTMPPLLDIEYNPYPSLGNTCYNFTPSAMVAWIKAFSNEVQARTGRLPMIYTTTDWWTQCTGNSAAFANQPLHIAAYSTALGVLPASWSFQSVWQYSSSGPFDGDSNVWNGTAASLATFAAKADGQPHVPSIASPADIVAVDGSGRLWDYPATGAGSVRAPQQIGHGWYNLRSVNVIDWNADGVLDLVAQWASGSVTLYKGRPGGGFDNPVTLAGSGWGGSQLTIGYWLNASAYPQILARTGSGDLYLWKNPSGGALDSGTQIGRGWGTLNLTMIDFDGDGSPDLLAQDGSGGVRLFRSNGSGGFINEPRKTVATGWNNYTSVTVYSDYMRPGSIGLIRRTAAGTLNYVEVPGNNTFGPAVNFGSGWGPYLIAGGENINTAPTPPAPSAPPAPTAVAGSASAVVKVGRAASGPAATKVVIAATSGGATCTIAAASGSCTVSGLTNGTAYAFKATASNAGGSSPASAASAPVTPMPPVTRLAGADRYATSAAVSAATFAPGVSTAYIASGANFPDALAGAAAAGTTGGPVLLAPANGITPAVQAELSRLKPKRIIMLGGPEILNNTVRTTLTKFSASVTRVAGADRYATSAAVSAATFAPGVSTAYIASGANFPDALAGAAAAGTTAGPVLLAPANGITPAVQAELSRLKPKRIIMLGGPDILNNNVKNTLTGFAG